MPLIRGYHDGRSAILSVAILDAARYREHKTLNDGSGFRGAKRFPALIDTGASITMISPRVVSALGLEQVNARLIMGVHGRPASRPAYLSHVAFYITVEPKNSDMLRLQVYSKVINGAELSEENTFDVLLGMDVLTTGDFHLSRDGTFSFSF